MRVLEIRFKNLNSLAGEWHIDLSHPAYTDDGIFAITGPTGVGKTTIMDAICLALYGQTPRLSRVTASANDIMTRHTGECYAEIIFEAHDKRYRCNWNQQRARKSPQGNLQPQKHEISCANTGAIIGSSIKATSNAIERITSMNYERFSRSMMLAQGEFAAFLQARADERTDILEQITGTEIYSTISELAFKRMRSEQDKLKELKSMLAGIELLTADDIALANLQIEEHKKQIEELTHSCSKLSEGITWHKNIRQLQQEIAELQDEHLKLQEKLENFKPKQKRLNLAQKAAPLTPLHSKLELHRTALQTTTRELANINNQLPQIQQTLEQQEQKLVLLQKTTAQAQKALTAAEPLLKTTRALDQQITTQREVVAKYLANCAQDQQNIASQQQELQQKTKEITEKQRLLDAQETYLQLHQQDRELEKELSGIEHSIGELNRVQKDIDTQTRSLSKLENNLKDTTLLLSRHHQQNTQLQQKLKLQQDKQTKLESELTTRLQGRLLREYEAELEALREQHLLEQRIASLEEQRSQLMDDKPCPLCGALDHPYAQGNLPNFNTTQNRINKLLDFINSIKEQLAEIETVKEQTVNIKDQYAEVSTNLKVAETRQANYTEQIQELEQQKHQLHQKLNQLSSALMTRLQPFSIAQTQPIDSTKILAELQQRLANWQQATTTKEKLTIDLANLTKTTDSITAIIQTIEKQLKDKKEQADNEQQRLTEICTARTQQFGTKDPDQEEAQLKHAITLAIEQEKEATITLNLQRQKHETTKTRITDLTHRQQEQFKEQDQTLLVFTAELKRLDFESEADYLSAVIDHEEMTELTKQHESLKEQTTTLATKHEDRTKRLAQEEQRAVTELSLDELLPELESKQATLQSTGDNLTTLRLKLKNNEDARLKVETQETRIKAQEEELSRWANLSDLIGSSDGKKYRNFVQGLTFDIVIRHANQQLASMSDRYQLERDSHTGLELNVIDHYQASERRTTKNLSGGESFIVSLALALGLSQMVSRNVRVDSLFLDEGFGTLDDESLETALETLANLQHHGKLIGVISHVPALKERIATKIEVTPLSNGHSRLSGPGCQKLKAT